MERANSTIEIEIERHVLPQTKKLSDGTFEKIFTRNSRNDSGIFTYNCRLCGVASLPGERAVQTHITGRKHQQRLTFDFVPEAQQFRAPIAVKSTLALPYFPGEPAPPGFEDEVETVSYIEKIGKKQSKPLIGLEYVVELVDVNAKEPFYICTLCDKRCDPRNIMPQITSHRHRMKYLDYHFPSLMGVLNREKKFNLDMSYREEVLLKVSSTIESKFGRSKPTICDYTRYEKNKASIDDEIRRKKHFCESDWPESAQSFLDNLKNVKAVDLDNVSSDEDREEDYNDARKRESRYVVPSRNVPSKQDQFVQRLLTPRELQQQSNTKLQETYVVEKYKAQVEIAIKDLEKVFKEYEKSPEKHPLYSEEWKAFWSRKYKELLAQGKDANSYDYKPEWIEFWTERMKELHKIDIDKKKETFRKKLGLTIDDVISKIESATVQVRNEKRRSRTRSPRRHPPLKSKSPSRIVEISDSDDDNSRRSNEPRAKRYRTEYRQNSEERSRNRFSENSPYRRSKDSYDSKYYTSRSRDYDRLHVKSKSPDIVDDGPVNLISVCRLLSALESELGLLAKTIIDLLAKAVALEKMKPNSADELLFSTENCNVLETVKEKLKGVLTANLIAPNKVVAVKRAVQNIATLLHEVSLRKPTILSKDVEKHSLDDAIDPVAEAKMQIAMVITESLIKQGRTDVPAEELEALIESFMTSVNDEESEEINVESEQEAVKIEMKKELKKQETSSVSGGLENLTDEDLQTLLRNFADLTSEEQTHLIAYLSKIEQTNPTRVEKLRKYVNIGDADDADFDENKDEDLDMDLAVTDLSTCKKSPEQIRQELSDEDDFNDDQMARRLGRSDSSSATQVRVGNDIKGAGTSSSLKDNSGLADSLMNSLIQSSQTPWSVQRNNENVMSSSAYYQQQQMSSYHDMPGNMSLYEQQLAMNNMAMSMQMQIPQESPWPQNAANFFQEAQIPSEFNANPREKVPFRKKYENMNNRQLTGKGKQRK